MIQFSHNGTAVGQAVPVANGVAIYTPVGALPNGQYSFTARYVSAGAVDGYASSSDSAALSLTVHGVVPVVDKSQLSAAVAVADGLNPSDYTAASWKGFQRVLGVAKVVLADANATQRQVDVALHALRNYMLEKPSATPKPGPSPAAGGNSAGSSGNLAATGATTAVAATVFVLTAALGMALLLCKRSLGHRR